VKGEHWVVTCINIFLKQINFFNSINASTITPCYEASNNLVITSCPFFISHDICFPFLAFACCNHHSFVLLRLQTFQRLYWNWKFLKRMCPSLSPSILQTTRTNMHWMIVVSTPCCTLNPGMERRWMLHFNWAWLETTGSMPQEDCCCPRWMKSTHQILLKRIASMISLPNDSISKYMLGIQ